MMINRVTYVLGLLLLFVGVLGLFPGYNLLHAIVGLGALYSSSDNLRAKRFNQFATALFAGLTIFALIPAGGFHAFLGLTPLYENEAWFHALLAAVVGYFGFVWGEKKIFSPAPKPTH